MNRFVILLRGVNVGGKNRVPMNELKSLLETVGYTDVSTYINSGNIIVKSAKTATEITEEVEMIISRRFSVNSDILVLEKQDFLNTVSEAPAWWGRDEGWKHNALFVLPPLTPDDVIEGVGKLKPEIEKLGSSEAAVFQSLLFTKFGQTSSGKLAGLPVYKQITIRNYNTTMKLAAMLQQ